MAHFLPRSECLWKRAGYFELLTWQKLEQQPLSLTCISDPAGHMVVLPPSMTVWQRPDSYTSPFPAVGRYIVYVALKLNSHWCKSIGGWKLQWNGIQCFPFWKEVFAVPQRSPARWIRALAQKYQECRRQWVTIQSITPTKRISSRPCWTLLRWRVDWRNLADKLQPCSV